MTFFFFGSWKIPTSRVGKKKSQESLKRKKEKKKRSKREKENRGCNLNEFIENLNSNICSIWF